MSQAQLSAHEWIQSRGRVPRLCQYCGGPRAAKTKDDGVSARRTNDDEALDRWLGALNKKNVARPKLAIVATSGGAIRSAVWTAVVLESLEDTLSDLSLEKPRFHDHVRLMTGASGGMLGFRLLRPVDLREGADQGIGGSDHEGQPHAACPADDLRRSPGGFPADRAGP